MNMSLMIIEVNYGAIDADDSTCNGYYIIKAISSPYTLESDLIIDGQVVATELIIFQSISILIIMFLQKI